MILFINAITSDEEREQVLDIFAEVEGAAYKAVYKIMGNKDDAADIMQELVIKIIKELQNLNDKMSGDEAFNLIGYMVEIAKNLCYTELKQRRRDAQTEGAAESAPTDKEFERDKGFVERLCSIDVATRLLAQIDVKHRVVIVLHYYKGFTYEDIADMLEMSRDGVKSRLMRGVRKMRKFAEVTYNG